MIQTGLYRVKGSPFWYSTGQRASAEAQRRGEIKASAATRPAPTNRYDLLRPRLHPVPTQLRGGVHEVGRREALRERAVNGRESGVGLAAAALPLPEPGQAHRGPQLPRPALLSAGCVDGLAEAVLGGGDLIGRLGQEQLALLAAQLGLLGAVVVLLRDCQALIQCTECFRETAGLRVRV